MSAPVVYRCARCALRIEPGAESFRYTDTNTRAATGRPLYECTAFHARCAPTEATR